MNKSKSLELKEKAKRYIAEVNKDESKTYKQVEREEKRAYKVLKQMYKESSVKERKQLRL